MNRIVVVCVIDSTDLFHTALDKFLGDRFQKDAEPVLFIYNIGEEEIDADKFLNIIPAPRVLAVFNCDSDLLTLKAYGRDYLNATADATVIATQLAGVECADFRYYNFFEPPKRGAHTDHEKAIKTLTNE